MIVEKLAERLILTMLAIAAVRFVTVALGRKNPEALENCDEAETGLMRIIHERMSVI